MDIFLRILMIIGIVLGTAVVLFLIFIAIPTIAGLFVDPNKIYDKDSKFYRGLFNVLLSVGMFFCNVKVVYEGDEKIPDGRFLLIGNHRSNFDPLLTAAKMKKYELAFISKEENFQLPIFGRMIRRLCYMPLKRDDARQALTIINHSAKLIKDDQCSVAVYPEGKRSFSGELLPFHGGVLKIAQKADVPIVVTTIEGTELIRKRFPRRTKVILRVIDVVPVEKVRATRSVELGEELHDQMLKALGR